MKRHQALLRVVVTLIALTTLSCKKEDVVVKTPEQLLTAAPWKLDELRYVQNNVSHYYKRGGTQNTESFSEEYIEFFSDKTGKYHSQDLSSVTLAWNFVNPEKTIMRYTLQGGLIITWENVILSEQSIRYTEYYNRGGTNSLAEGFRTPK